MGKSKKFIMMLTLAILALVGGTTGMVMAASSNDGEDSQAVIQRQAIRDRVCEIYETNTGIAIDSDQLQNAFRHAREEIREQALLERIAELVEDGIITQEEADELLGWWQARPDIELQGLSPGIMDGLIAHNYGGGMMGGGHFRDGCPYCSDTSGDISDETNT